MSFSVKAWGSTLSMEMEREKGMNHVIAPQYTVYPTVLLKFIRFHIRKFNIYMSWFIFKG